ncbi:hypothetical protein HYPBUDRAFT_8833 [Hyphopichia burtonii NRRL Y-1933]|uniref:Inheritance of peroxisomes protein 1 n=1 Tax=Hyphopichia burtonii NRRL Y-1933 TaxID=984485 RepID=A0A1E4RQW7_9ASCO|nr:hypothetical protein HYPBUDRAFT_8833 [Hyphopichia burtonii NRRL Y-1933]ODV69455.1 hypothetical protein HYPBUDRAFT_8833 [Hyphopichia burtonii NRRL Y-1933]
MPKSSLQSAEGKSLGPLKQDPPASNNEPITAEQNSVTENKPPSKKISILTPDLNQENETKEENIHDDNNTSNPSKSKRKKKRSKAKNKPNTKNQDNLNPPNSKAVSQSVAPAPLRSTNSPLSPRKQAIMRYKKSDDKMNEHNFFSEVKENMKKRSPPATHNYDEDDKYSTILAQQNMEGKASLFKFSSAKILVYHSQLSDEHQSSGRLLGHGEFEVFQLHNGDVTYLSCGRSFVYPLLPKLKILRIAFNQFILPLLNPERYWKIFINSEDYNKIQKLENTLNNVVQYRNLYYGPNDLKLKESKEIEESTNSNPALTINEKPAELQIQSTKNNVPIVSSLVNDDSSNKYSFNNKNLAVFAEIPDSPPSAPISPQPIIDEEYTSFNLLASDYQKTPLAPPLPAFENHPERLLNKQKSMNSITSAMASFDVYGPSHPTNTDPSTILDKLHNKKMINPSRSTAIKPHNQQHPLSNSFTLNNTSPQQFFNDGAYKNILELHQPKPTKIHKSPNLHSHDQAIQKLQHAHRMEETKSDSSMDSLLDEYEEHLSVSKSMTFTHSRPPSTSISERYNLNSRLHGGNYNLRFWSSNNNHSGLANSQFGDPEEDYEDYFPSTSLSGYNQARMENHNNNPSNRSRRSSHSELYTSMSNWMEPGKGNGAHPPVVNKPYSISNGQDNNRTRSANGQDLNNTYRNIYKSITQRNLNQYIDEPRSRSKSKGSHKPVKMASSNNLNGGVVGYSREASHRSRSDSVSRLSEYSKILQSYTTQYPKPPKRPNPSKNRNSVGIELNPSEVYKMISSNRQEIRKEKPKNRSLASKIFGW